MTHSRAPKPHPIRIRRPRRAAAGQLAALAILLSLLPLPWAGAAFSGEPEPLAAALLTRDLGDPRAPGNLKLVLTLPAALASRTASVKADDFVVHVYPAGIPEEDGPLPEHRADGLYLWRRGDKIFLDVRVVPEQEEEGPATVRVAYAPGGTPLAVGHAEGESRYAADLADVVLAVDVSRSMIYNDPRKRRVAAARTFIEMARQGGGIGRVGLVTFNHRANVTTPLLPLEEGDTLLAALNRVGADGLTSLDAPLRLGMRELSGIASQRPVVILMTDGRNEGSSYKNTHRECAEAGVRLFTVGLTESADHELLKEMAEATGGMYFRAPTDADLPEIYSRLAAELGKRQLLHAGILRSREGSVALPIDGSVRRLVALADAGARLGVSGPGGSTLFAGDGMTAVHLGVPEPGEWVFRWEDATPDLSLLALFGDTRFFLDVFPPQLRGDKLAIGATLARGAQPLAEAEVWVESLPGVAGGTVRLFDDGLHGDGMAGDGVYGAVVDYAGDEERFDIMIRAAGEAWNGDAFVRQAVGLAIRSPEPVSAGSASLDGDVDFGVLFPGETGTGRVQVDLDAPRARDLFFDLSWDAPRGDWPDLASRVTVEPGRRAFEIEMTVPETAVPGDYRGFFSISDGGDLGDNAQARVKVGTVRFPDGDAVDLGEVPPGTFASRDIGIAFSADKEAALEVRVDGGGGMLAATTEMAELPRGEGTLPVAAVVTVPMGADEGEYHALLELRAGPGRAAIPLRWRVKAYAPVAARDFEPVEGLPRAPSLTPEDDAALLTPETASELRLPDLPVEAPPAVESPWEKTAELFRSERAEGPEIDYSRPIAADFPRITPPSDGGDSFWSAWWWYLLAALLLLLLLLILIAYILYRLQKSALVRFLVLSAIVNIVLLIVFIALLGASTTVAARERETIAVSLVEDDYEPMLELSETEKGMLSAVASPSDAASSGAPSAIGEIALEPGTAGGGLTPEKLAAPPAESPEPIELADASPRASAQPLDDSRETLQRRVRRPERTRLEPVAEMREMAEPPAESGRQASERPERDETQPEIGETRLDIQANPVRERPVWSESERVAMPQTSERGAQLSEPVGSIESVSIDETARRLDPRGRRRVHREIPVVHPEPRVEIVDPARDAVETPVPEASAQRGDVGVEEQRFEPQAMGVAEAGRRPGAPVLPGVSPLTEEVPDISPKGVSGPDAARAASPRGGLRSARGGTRAGASRPGPAGGVPGGLGQTRVAMEPRRGDGRTGGEQGGEVGERRFDDAAGVDGDGGEGRSRLGDLARTGGGAAAVGISPKALAGDGALERTTFPGSGGGPVGSVSGPPRRGRNGSNGTPDTASQLPAGNGGRQPDGKGDDANAGGRVARRGLGEGRIDDMAAMPGGASATQRIGLAQSSGGQRPLVAPDASGTLDVVAFAPADSEWRRNGRRFRQRSMNVAASSVDMDSLLIVVGDFARLPDAAARNLFGVLAKRIAGGMTVEERNLTPNDINLSDCLLAVLSPEEVADWSDGAVEKLAGYLRSGGHLWMDAETFGKARPFMERLARAVGGEYGPLDPAHQLSDEESVEALSFDDTLAAVVTRQDWRRRWRYGDAQNGRTLRFLIRSLNFFLSGDAEAGIVLEDDKITDALFVEPTGRRIPEVVSNGASSPGRAWDDFTRTAAAWRMPTWSDPGRASVISDGQGRRALKLDLFGAVKGRVATYRVLNPAEDFSPIDRVTLDIYYDGEGESSLSLVLTVPHPDGGWLDYESPSQVVAPGWNTMVFPLGGGDFRSLAEGGGYERVVRNDDQVGRVGFFLYREADSAAAVMLRDIRLHDN